MEVPEEDRKPVTDSFTGVTTRAPSPSNGQTNGHVDDEVKRRLASADSKIMEVWGGQDGLDLSSKAEFTKTSNHPILNIASRRPGSGFYHRVQMDVFHAIRRYIPVFDSAIENRRDIEGNIRIESDDEGLQRDLEQFSRAVPVGNVEGAPQKGLNTYLNLIAGSSDEYGIGAGEVVIDSDGRGIERLRVASPRTLSIEDQNNDNLYEVYQRQGATRGRSGEKVRIDQNDRVHMLAFRPSIDRPWPKPLSWSLVQTSEVLLRLYESVANGWWRFGDPSMLVTEEYEETADPDTTSVNGVEVPVSLLSLKSTLEEVFKDRKQGKVSDAYHSSVGAEVSAEVIGNVDATLMRWFAQHNNVFAGQVIGAGRVPVWMHPEVQLSGEGLNSDRSQNQTVMAAEAAKDRNVRKRQIAREVLNLFLVVSGASDFVGEYRLVTDEAAIIDDAVKAEAEKTRAEANQIHAQVANMLYESDGSRRFQDGEHEDYLRRHGVYPNDL